MARIEVKIEDPGDFEEVEVVDVSVAAGDTVAEGDVLLEIATDKANMDIVAPAAGTVEEVLVAVDDIVPVDRVLVVLAT
jgi:pyruvate/2-oxoglutarate dehydrogenase complex dihydrolipoamide acyltransferase (E2) component